jgi:probable F420-dependent oxidoreductase
MRIGVAFPTTEIGDDPAVIRDFVQAAEELGYAHVTCIDHVVQAGTAEAGWRSYYTRDNAFHEPLILFAFAAAVTRRIELAPAVLVLPQRQATLVAKQAAELDVLSGGRLRLGVGIGWNEAEYEALGQDFRNRARRFEEQIEVLRALWAQDLVTFRGQFHRLTNVGLNPAPLRRPPPLWLGAFETRAIARAGRLADGWFLNPRVAPGSEAEALIGAFQAAARDAGRDPAQLGMDATLHLGDKTPERIAAEAEAWRGHGVTHVTLRTIYSGLRSPAEHIETIRKLRDALPLD